MKRLANYSQYFLRNPRFIAGLLKLTSITSRDLVIDIGAGSGVITSQLASVAESVLAIEHEPRIARKLKENMASFPSVQVVHGDFLTLPLPSVPYKVFANIPFHLSSPIVRRLVEADHPSEAIYLIVQKQFANKLLPNHEGFSGQLGMQVGPLFEVKILKRLRRTDYWPHPNVDTVLIGMELRKKPLIPRRDMRKYRSFVERSFSTPAFFATTPRRAVGLAEDIKPSQMVLDDWVRLFLAA